MNTYPNQSTILSHPLSESLANQLRLTELNRTQLLGSSPEPIFDRYTYVAARVLDVPITLFNLVANDYQFTKSYYGLSPELAASDRNKPLTHSLCKHVVHWEQPLMVENAIEHPLVKNNLGVLEDSVIAYLGIPIETNGQSIGAFCAINNAPRSWTAYDLALMKVLAEGIEKEIATRIQAYELDLLNRENQTIKTELISLLTETKRLSSPTLESVHQQVAELALRDCLTDCFNRDYLPMAFDHAIDEIRSGNPCCVMTLEIDNFKTLKRFVPHYSVGDRLLKAYAGTLKSCLRRQDYLLRIGSDKFMIFLKEISLNEAKIRAELVRRRLERFVFHDSKRDFIISTSIGLVELTLNCSLGNLFFQLNQTPNRMKVKSRNGIIACSTGESYPLAPKIIFDHVTSKSLDMLLREFIDLRTGAPPHSIEEAMGPAKSLGITARMLLEQLRSGGNCDPEKEESIGRDLGYYIKVYETL